MKIEINATKIKDIHFITDKNIIMITPPIDENYWIARVKLYKDQYVQCFPKFGLIGIGFSREDDWNTNLPSKCDSKEIADHIWHNKFYRQIKKQNVLEAINLLKNFIEKVNKNETK